MMVVTWAGALICLLAGILLGLWVACDVLLGPLKESVDQVHAVLARLVAAQRAQGPHPDAGEVVAVVEPVTDATELSDPTLTDEERDAFMAAIRREGKPGTKQRGGREFSPPPPPARGGSYYVPSANLAPEEAPLFDSPEEGP